MTQELYHVIISYCENISTIALKEMLPLELYSQHVIGDQNALLYFEELDRFAQLNVMMDTDTKRILEELACKEEIG